jgi:hypothetical protein
MTLMSRLMVLFPVFHVAGFLTLLAWSVGNSSWLGVLLLPLWIYLVPPLLHRIHDLLFPLKEGASRISDPVYSPWWGSHQLQLLFVALPGLDSLLRIVPGLYSAWLRLWGSRIGKSVHWTPSVQIADRSLLEIGDGVVFGHKSECYSHVIRPQQRGQKQSLILYIRKVRIGRGAFIGAGSRLGPGAVIAEGTFLPVLTDVYLNQTIANPEKAQIRSQAKDQDNATRAQTSGANGVSISAPSNEANI